MWRKNDDDDDDDVFAKRSLFSYLKDTKRVTHHLPPHVASFTLFLHGFFLIHSLSREDSLLCLSNTTSSTNQTTPSCQKGFFCLSFPNGIFSPPFIIWKSSYSWLNFEITETYQIIPFPKNFWLSLILCKHCHHHVLVVHPQRIKWDEIRYLNVMAKASNPIIDEMDDDLRVICSICCVSDSLFSASWCSVSTTESVSTTFAFYVKRVHHVMWWECIIGVKSVQEAAGEYLMMSEVKSGWIPPHDVYTILSHFQSSFYLLMIDPVIQLFMCICRNLPSHLKLVLFQ